MIRPASALLILFSVGCAQPEAEGGFPGYTPGFTVVAGHDDGLDRPQDLGFHPSADRSDELWLVNKGTEESGSDVVIITGTGSSTQQSEVRRDPNAWHFMNLTSAMAFSDNGRWATSPEVTDANHSGGLFTGPSLWSSNLGVFAQDSGGNGSHLDMLHQSPNSMGIAHEVDNVFWVFDGYSNHILRYQFGHDHGPGAADHSDGRVKRFVSLPITREPGVPAHMILDKSTNWLYICDPGNSQVLRLDITSGERDFELPFNMEPLAVNVQMKNEVWEVFADTGLDQPSGIELHDGRLYVSDAATGEIIGYSVETGEELGRIQTNAGRIVGLQVGPSGNLWYVDRRRSELVRIDQGEE